VRHGTAMFWWKDETSRFLGFCPRLSLASGVEGHLLVGHGDADPRVAWTRQAALYMRDDREVKVPYTSTAGAGTVGGFDTISVSEAQRLTKLAR
jgi:hypothetical protein